MKVGLKTILGMVRRMDDKALELYSIMENLQRLDFKSEKREKAIQSLWRKCYAMEEKSMA